MEGPSHSKAPGEEHGDQHTLQDAVLLGDKQPPPPAEGKVGASRGSAARENGFPSHPSLVLLLPALVFGLFADVRTHPGLGWPVAFVEGQ